MDESRWFKTKEDFHTNPGEVKTNAFHTVLDITWKGDCKKVPFLHNPFSDHPILSNNNSSLFKQSLLQELACGQLRAWIFILMRALMIHRCNYLEYQELYDIMKAYCHSWSLPDRHLELE